MNDNSKKPTTLTFMRKTYPTHIFRKTKSGTIQRKYLTKWLAVCSHDRKKSLCVECNGSQTCEHKKIKANCFECGGYNICVHKKNKYTCITCGGPNICEHKKLKSQCIDCGGSQICAHNHIRSKCNICNMVVICKHRQKKGTCKKCKGMCIHEKKKATCKECGGSALCVHEKIKATCKECGGSRICKCGERIMQKDNLCNRCNPNFIGSEIGASKIACHFIDDLEKELNLIIKHRHLDITEKKWCGSEHRPLKWQRKSVDGYYVDIFDGMPVGIEFLGDYCHGHPRLWDGDKQVYLELRFNDTQKKLLKLKELGYKVYYVWESDFKNKTATQNLASICREFENKLFWD